MRFFFILIFLSSLLFSAPLASLGGHPYKTGTGFQFVDTWSYGESFCDSSGCNPVMVSSWLPASNFLVVNDSYYYCYTAGSGDYYLAIGVKTAQISGSNGYAPSYAVTHYKIYTNSSCPSGTVLDVNTRSCEAPVIPTCPTNSHLDSNTSTCVPDNGYVCPDNVCNSTSLPILDPDSPLGDYDNDGISNQCDDDYSDYNNLDCDGDGDVNSVDPSPKDGTVTKASQSGSNPDSNSNDCENYQTFRESISDTGWVKFGNYQHLNCDKIELNNLFYNGLNRSIAISDKSTCAPDCIGYVKLCPTGKLYDNIKGYCVGFQANPTDCVETSNKKLFTDSGKCYEEFYCENGKPYATYLVTCPDTNNDGLPDDNITVGSNTDSNALALEKYGASTKANQETIISELESNTQVTRDISSKFDTLLSKTKTANKSLDGINDNLTNLNTKASNTNTLLIDTNSKLLSSLSNDNRRDNLLGSINNSLSDLNNSSFSPDSSSYATSQSELESSLLSLDSLKSDFTDFQNNILQDLSTTVTSFDNAKSLFSDGSLELESISIINTCPKDTVLMGKTYTVDLCEVVSPFNNVIYTLFYMLGFFSILITFAYIFVLKGVD